MYSHITLIGRLTRDPETRETKKGGTMTTARLAYQTRFLGQNHDNYVDLVLFGNLAVTFANYARRGRRVLLEGQLRIERTTNDETNQMRERVRVFVTDFKFLDNDRSSNDDDDNDDDADLVVERKRSKNTVQAKVAATSVSKTRYFDDDDDDAYDPFDD